MTALRTATLCLLCVASMCVAEEESCLFQKKLEVSSKEEPTDKVPSMDEIAGKSLNSFKGWKGTESANATEEAALIQNAKADDPKAIDGEHLGTTGFDADQMGNFIDQETMNAKAVEQDEIMAAADDMAFQEIGKIEKAHFRESGPGHCRKDYLGGWDGYGLKSVQDCANFCLHAEPGCKFIAYVHVKASGDLSSHPAVCSRYGETCGKLTTGAAFSMDSEHTTYQVAAKPVKDEDFVQFTVMGAAQNTAFSDITPDDESDW